MYSFVDGCQPSPSCANRSTKSSAQTNATSNGSGSVKSSVLRVLHTTCEVGPGTQFMRIGQPKCGEFGALHRRRLNDRRLRYRRPCWGQSWSCGQRALCAACIRPSPMLVGPGHRFVSNTSRATSWKASKIDLCGRQQRLARTNAHGPHCSTSYRTNRSASFILFRNTYEAATQKTSDLRQGFTGLKNPAGRSQAHRERPRSVDFDFGKRAVYFGRLPRDVRRRATPSPISWNAHKASAQRTPVMLAYKGAGLETIRML